MFFNSYIFVFLFLPVTIIGYYLLRSIKGINNSFLVLYLLIQSLWFYGWANIRHLFLLIASIVINYIVYRLLLLPYQDKKVMLWRRGLLFCTIAGNLFFLALFRYYNFFAENLNTVFRTDLAMREFVVPLGISFITFSQIAFVVDAYRQEIPQYYLYEYAAYTAFFPKISSGPIALHQELLPMFRDMKMKPLNWERLAGGFYLFGMGLGKKALLADTFGRFVDWGYGNLEGLNVAGTWLVVIGYSFQIYFDFSGYSDMAVGIARMLNLDLPVNFSSPYQADTILDFWKKWHITLTRFLTKYIYIPLGGNRKGKVRMWLNTMIVFGLSGLWHGANWTFVLWGLVHGGLQIISKGTHNLFKNIPCLCKRICTFVCVSLAWVLFRADSIEKALQVYQKLIGRNNENNTMEFYSHLQFPMLHELVTFPVWMDAVVLFCGAAFIVFFCKNAEERSRNLRYGTAECIWLILVIVISLFTFSGVNSYIYYNF